jgi:hypothetical protein
MKKLLLISCLGLAGTMSNATTMPQAKPTECVVKTYDQHGVYLATLLPGDGVPLSLAAAATSAKKMNARHNTGTNPVVARYTCS